MGIILQPFAWLLLTFYNWFDSYGLALILYVSGGTDNPLNYAVLVVTILAMSAFFSIHYLTVYYLLQPYTASTELKSGTYRLAVWATYLVCFLLLQVEVPPLLFGILSVVFCLVAVNVCGTAPTVAFPGGFVLDLGVLSTTFDLGGATVSVPWIYLAFVFLLMAGLSNAVNLTDGLDGLAGGTSMIAMLIMAAIAFLHNDVNLAIFSASCGGACLGFLWFNCYPASIFMGDTGSLALGSAFACMAIMTNTEVVSLVIGGLFIAETLSVMIQVVSFKATGKRVFLMAPIHHHFERLGWAETKVVIRFWIVSAAFGALGLALFFQLG